MITLCPLTRDQANVFVRKWHTHHRPVHSHRFAIGAQLGGVVVGVAMVGTPVARALCDGYTLEVVRLACRGGDRNVASTLLGACWRAAKAMGCTRLVSYTREDEAGTCYRAAGWRVAASVKGRPWTTGHGRTRWLPGMYDPSSEVVDRVRWERVA